MSIDASVAAKNHVTLKCSANNRAAAGEGRSVHMQQVVLNLVMNGIDALEGCDSNARSVTIETVQRDKANVSVAVTDNGKGISEANLSNIFEPFLTTKAHGTGLGLPISRQVDADLTGYCHTEIAVVERADGKNARSSVQKLIF